MARWTILSRQFDCFGKLAVTVALPLAVELDLDNCLAGRFFSLLVARFVTLWLPKNTKLKYTQENNAHESINTVNARISAQLQISAPLRISAPPKPQNL